MRKDPSQEASHRDHTTRRLETFSDIVIAFTLSQLALTLKLPAHSRDLLAHPFAVLLFLFSFILIAGMWWLHHRIFARYFFPDTVSILLNFAFLATTVYVAFSYLLMTTFGDVFSFAAYELIVGGAYLILALLAFKGLRDSRIVLDEADRDDGTQITQRVGLVGGAFVIAGLLLVLGVSENLVLYVPMAAGVAVAIMAARARLARRRREREAGGSASASR